MNIYLSNQCRFVTKVANLDLHLQSSMCYVRSTDGELPVVYDSSLSVNYIDVGKFTKCGVTQILKTSKDL